TFIWQHSSGVASINNLLNSFMANLRHTLLYYAVYLVRHFVLTHQRVEGFAPLEWNAVASPLGAVNGQDGTKDEFCVRLTSIWLSQLACTGVCTMTTRG